ncbi:hypothetical protein ABIB73_003582 [Bradyrhizobium sp. F1.4.3]
MEPERNETDHASEQTEAQRTASAVKQPVLTPPFASEGLERLRESHC